MIKTNKPLITIIVPIYNKELVLKHCLKSIEQQKYKNLQVVLINDGSTDSSPDIAREFANKDARFEYYSQTNQGVSAARNMGLKFSRGYYLCFVDADDYIDIDYIEKLYLNMKFDFTVCGYKQWKNNKLQNIILPTSTSIPCNDVENFIFKKKVFDYMCVPWTKMFKTNIIRENNLTFKSIPLGEDTIFVLRYISCCKCINTINYDGYNNVILNNTLSRKKIANLWNINLAMIDELNKIYNYKYNSNWAFIYFRAIKMTLGNMHTYECFKSQCHLIYNNKDFDYLAGKLLKSKKDKILYFLLKYRFLSLLYVAFMKLA